MDSTKEEFIDWMRQAVHEAALLAHQCTYDAGAVEVISRVRAESGAGWGAWFGCNREMRGLGWVSFLSVSYGGACCLPHRTPNPQLLHEMSARSICLCNRHMWFFSVLNENHATGEIEAAPESVWKRTASSMSLKQEQVSGHGVESRAWGAVGLGKCIGC